jgi:hypothetical protein
MVCMATAHFVDFKIPILFVYYDVESIAYQNKIIAFTCSVYALLFHCAVTVPGAAVYGPLALIFTAIGLSLVNVSDALKIYAKTDLTMYWAQTAMIGSLALLMLYAHLRKL